jgi:hypothetical protein
MVKHLMQMSLLAFIFGFPISMEDSVDMATLKLSSIGA